MLRSLLHRQIGKLERAYSYDATYLHEVTDASVPAILKFMLFQVMSQHRDRLPRDLGCAARIAAALTEDCGPCVQITVDMALQAGMAPEKIAALLRGDIECAGEEAELGFRYGIAVATNAIEAADLAEQVLRRYGKRAQVSMAYSVASARVYPTLKRGLGHGAACTKIRVADDSIAILKAA